MEKSSTRRWSLWLSLLATGALIALLRFKPEAETDLGWHLAQGRLLLAGQAIRENALSWIAPHEPWVDTSGLFDALCTLSTRAFPQALGPQLVAALFFALTAAALGLCGMELAGGALGAALAPLSVLLLWHRATPRPHVASWAVLAWTLFLCLRAAREADPRPRLRVWALGLIALGGCLHAGAAFAAAVLGLFALEAAWRSRSPRGLWLLVAAPLALLVNPSGVASVVHLLRHWSVQETVRIREFEPLSLLHEPAFVPLVLLALACLWPQRRTRPALLAATLLFGLLGLRAERMAYEATVVALPALGLGLCAIERRSSPRTAWLAAVLCFCMLLAPHRTLARLSAQPAFDPRWDEHLLPVRAARFLDEHGVTGPGYNGLRDGGYLAWARPAVPIFVDARLHAYPAALWHTLDLAEDRPPEFRALLRSLGCEWAISTRSYERLGGYRRLDGPDWALVYWDDISEVFVRRDVARFAPLAAALEYKHFRPYGSIVGAVERLPREELSALDAEVARFLVTSPGDLFAGVVACASAVRQEKPQAAALCDETARAASESGRPEVLALVEKARAQR